MKTQSYIASVLLFLSLVMCSQMSAGTEKDDLRKIYVKEDVIVIKKNGIFIQTTEGLFRAKALRSDRHGLYVFTKDLRSTRK